uniref:C-type lectin-like n=1 Tax=Crassostrea virginica TaxID=6565 RepID=A0A8B8F096_CRAVI|nr:C-type lectin-like [Crassostrea virginica]
MEYKVILLLTLIIKVQGVLVSDNMTRNPLYDTKAPLGTNIILTLNLSSSLTCASHCTTNPTCKSLLYNTITQYCQLLSVQMKPGLDNGPQTSTGWRYYERKIDCGKWHHFLGHWYLRDPTRRTFDDSRTFCADQSPKSYVVEVQSQAENDWLVTLTSTHCGDPYEYWLNGFDTDDSGSFMWIDSQTLTNYTNWYTVNSEPNNPAEKCVVASTGWHGVWNDIYCSFLRPVVCERNT